MKFVDHLDVSLYASFFDTHDAHFLQSVEWGDFCRIGKHMEPFYMGVVDEDGNLLAASLFLQKKLYFGYSYLYAPRGFILDYSNEELFSFFTDSLKSYMKKNRVVFITVDPAVTYQERTPSGDVVEGGIHHKDIYQRFLDLGYLHKGFSELYEGNQVRHTFMIDLNQPSFDLVFQKFNKSMRKNMQKAMDYGLETVCTDDKDLSIFQNLMKSTAERDSFIPYSDAYYEAFYSTFHANQKCALFVTYLYPKRVCSYLKEHTSLEGKWQDMYAKYSVLEEEKIPLNAHMIVLSGTHGTALYAANSMDYKEVYSNYLTYYTKIKYAYDHGMKDFDLFGVCGRPTISYKNYAGIYEFKKQFGGDLLEYLGEFDLPVNSLFYRIVVTLLSIRRKIKH